MTLNSNKLVFLLLLIVGASFWPCSIYALTSEQEREAADLISKGDYYLLRTFKADGIGMADGYRTPIIMDSLLELLKHPERAGEDDEFITWREIYAIATDSKDPRMVPDLAAHKGVGPKEISLFVKRMPKEAYEYSVDPKHFQPVVLKELLSHPGLLTTSQRQQIRDTTLKRLENNTSNEVPTLLNILGVFAKENDVDSIFVLKKYAENNFGEFSKVAINNLSTVAYAGNSTMVNYLVALSSSTVNKYSRVAALDGIAGVIIKLDRPELLDILETNLKNNLSDWLIANSMILDLANIAEATNSARAEAIVRSLALEGNPTAKKAIRNLEWKRRRKSLEK